MGANVKDIKRKISSINSTKKITRAMEMVAASKLRRAQENMEATRPYFDRIISIMGNLVQATSDYEHPFLTARDVSKVGYIVVSSDRGLCAGLNNNLFKSVVSEFGEYQKDQIEVDICVIGKKAEDFFKRVGGNIVASTCNLKDNVELKDLVGSIKVMVDAYLNHDIDKLCISYNHFQSSVAQKPTTLQVLPVVTNKNSEEDTRYSWDYIYEPKAELLLDKLLQGYIDSVIYQAVIENITCEQAARMVAMKNASDNAEDLITKLQSVYNKARQASITQEIAEIVAGAAAV